MGFGADVRAVGEKDLVELYRNLHPDDLVKFGLIPEFIGRLPVSVALSNLEKQDLKRIITEPRNSIIKQYQASLKLDDVDLQFDESAIEAIAEKAITRKTGARGLKAIVEETMIDIMFELPSIEGSKEVLITEDTITGKEKPVVREIKKSA